MIEHVFVLVKRPVSRGREGATGYVSDMTQPPPPLDGVAMAELVRSGEATPLELVDEAITRSDRVNGDLNAVIHPLAEAARAQATEMGAAVAAGDTVAPLGGVPFLTKDLMCATEGDPLHEGNATLRDIDHRAPRDTYLATMFHELGLVNIGRTNTPEFGLTITTEPAAYGPTRNPWNLDHSTGGSSGGSAAAVAAGIVPVAHANDGGGSIRIPASECGLFGLKPTRGRVSQGPDGGEMWAGAAIEGVITRSVRDSAVVLDGISREWPGDPYSAALPDQPFATAPATEPDRLRIGICPTSEWGEVHPECSLSVDVAGRLMEELGHDVTEAHPAALFDDQFFDNFRTVIGVAVANEIDGLQRLVGDELQMERDTRAFVELGRRIGGIEYITAVEWFHAYTRRMAEWWESYDILVTPILTEPPPELGVLRDPAVGRELLRRLLHFTPQFNVTGQPAMSVPLHWSSEGLPVGVQFVGSAAAEFQLLQVAGQLERARPWSDRTPPVFAW